MIKGCPFCGKHPRITRRASTPSERGNNLCFITCTCGKYVTSARKFGFGNTQNEADSAAVSAWNERKGEVVK